MSNSEEALGESRRPGAAPQREILGLDLLRCLAALLVMLHHYFGSIPLWVPAAELGSYSLALLPYTWFGWVGVQIFFVISGFVIAFSASQATPARFARSRFLRLFPTLWICATLTLAVALLAHAEPARKLIHEWMHSIVLDPRQTPYIDGAYWTLPVEVSFYGLIFLLLWRRAFRHIGLIAACLGVLSSAYTIYRFGEDAGLVAHLARADRGVHWIETISSPSTLIHFGVYFALGTQLWLFLFERKTVGRALLLGLFVLSGALGVYSYGRDFIAMLSSTGTAYALSPLPAVAIWLAGLATIAASVVFNKGAARSGARPAAATIRKLGMATYPIYLLHQVIGHIVIRKLHGHLPDALSSLALLLLIPAFCLIALPRIESPLQAKLKGLLGSPQKSAGKAHA